MTSRALLIGIDGVRLDTLREVATPRIDDYFAEPTQSLDLLRSTLEIKTTWHPVGW